MPELDEKDFIQEGYSKDPTPFWIWLLVLIILSITLWFARSWYLGWFEQKIAGTPFQQVTNREISLFLWQNPEHMRAHSISKNNYLPGFRYSGSVAVSPEVSDEPVVAPPEVIFLYHVWDRLIDKESFDRIVISNEFKKFLDDDEQWKPENWPEAPKEYVKFIEELPNIQPDQNLSSLQKDVFPKAVRQAFQGWKNYMQEGDDIDKIEVTYEEIIQFLDKHPHYSRNFWINILADSIPGYLMSLSYDKKPSDKVPRTELSPFLKAAIFNFKHELLDRQATE
jgi:hypothetical protein